MKWNWFDLNTAPPPPCLSLKSAGVNWAPCISILRAPTPPPHHPTPHSLTAGVWEEEERFKHFLLSDESPARCFIINQLIKRQNKRKREAAASREYTKVINMPPSTCNSLQIIASHTHWAAMVLCLPVYTRKKVKVRGVIFRQGVWFQRLCC